MTGPLDEYLVEISRYLAVKDGADDILEEIKSHILEKTNEEFGAVSEEGLRKTIAAYGPARHVAAKYVEGVELISPVFKKHLFLYTGILFCVHSAMTLIAYLFQIRMFGFPILYIPLLDAWQALWYLPMAFVSDLGIVVLFLYWVTQQHRDVRLPWPSFPATKNMRPPKVTSLVLLILAFGFLLFLVLRFGTLFFASMNAIDAPTPLFGQSASLYYSVIFLAMVGCEAMGYAARFFIRSGWPDLVKAASILVLLHFVWNSPVHPDFTAVPGLDVHLVAVVFVSILTMLAVWRFLRDLIAVTKELLTRKR